MAPKTSIGAWVDTLWSLVAHFVLSIGLTVFILIYVDGHHFNVTNRSLPVNTAEGTQKAPFNLLQSDIVTIVSSLIVVLKCALMSWVAPLIWRVAIFLMERRGLARRNLQILLQYGVLAPGGYSRDFSTLIISSLPIASLAANIASPLLTGSISWVPSNQLARNLPVGPIQFEAIGAGVRKALTNDYLDFSHTREMYVSEGVGPVGVAWGCDNDKGILKRFSRSVEALAIKSTVENAILSYFEVHSIRYP
ncbi:hypothetical protein ACGC1H_005028 [Rhizoctonia solani]